MKQAFPALRVFIISFLLFFLPFAGEGQNNNLSLPFIRSFDKSDFNGGTQSWDFEQDSLGRIYVANNDGVLIFDGTNWELIYLPNRTIVRSLLIDPSGKLFVGGQDEFGYFESDPEGNFQFHGIRSLIPEDYNHFEDVWDIKFHDGAIFWLSSSRVYRFDGEQVEVFTFNRPVPFLGQVNNRLLIQDIDGQFKQWNQGTFETVGFLQAIEGDEISDLISLSDQSFLMLTLKNGIYLAEAKEKQQLEFEEWDLAPQELLKQNRIYAGTKLQSGEIALGTILGGLMILDPQGRLQYLLDKSRGLQNNAILNLFEDADKGLWLGLDNGIDRLEINAPFSKIIPDGKQQGQGYAAKIINNTLYLGTSNGLYSCEWQGYYDPLDNQCFKRIDGSVGQVWQLNQIEDQLLMSHHEGLFQVSNNRAKKISPFSGAWRSIPLKNHPGYFLVGSYEGLHLFFKLGDSFTFIRTYSSFRESSRIIAHDEQGMIWVAHPYRGLFRIQLSDDLSRISAKQYGEQDGLPFHFGIRVFQIDSEVLFGTEKGLYRFDYQSESFQAAKEFNDVLGKDSWIKFIRKDAEGNFWFVANNDCGVLWVTDEGLEKKIEKQILPEPAGKLVGGFENIVFLNEQNVVFPTEKGFFHLDPVKLKEPNKSLNIVINEIHFGNESDSTEWSGLALPEKQVEVAYQKNAFSCAFSATNFSTFGDIKYQYQLIGLDKEPSPWLTKTEKEYTNLPKGKYTFEVRARNAYLQESQTRSFSFVVKPPWYSSTAALTVYCGLFLFLFGSMIWIPQSQFQKEKAQLVSQQAALEKEHQAEVQKSEQEIMRLHNEKLESEVHHKNQELAATAMHLVQKTEILTRIKQELSQLSGSKDQNEIKKEIRRLVKVIDKDIEFDKNWEQFEHHFDQVHHDYLKSLRQQFPQLTPKDRKLCAYLRMNLQTKEIAPLMNISVRGVEISRYRLRKKLELSRETNLIEFLMSV